MRHISPGSFAADIFGSSGGTSKAQIVEKTRARNALMDSSYLQEFANSFELLESRVSDKTIRAVASTRHMRRVEHGHMRRFHMVRLCSGSV